MGFHRAVVHGGVMAALVSQALNTSAGICGSVRGLSWPSRRATKVGILGGLRAV